ncbi:MAG TPA: glycosyltransferase [Lacipirellulaceae bacterium]|nr:glycosyltransferase [Lacipirellulaceae bacterium]
MPQFIITALGSYGDVHPMIGLGTALAARGHRVQIITNPYFEDLVAQASLDFLPIGTREDYIRFTQHPDLWHPIRGPQLVLKHACVELLRPVYRLLSDHMSPGATVFCAHALDLASRVAGEKFGVPVASVNFAPSMFWTLNDTSRFKGALLGPRVPKWLKRLQFWLADEVVSPRLWGNELNRMRAELGMAPANRIFTHWLHATDLVLGLFPDWFGPPQPDWPPNTRAVGFPLWDSPGSVPIFRSVATSSNSPDRKMGNDPLGGELRAFLASGSPPIAFSPGSANREAHEFFVAAVDACRRLGRRGILLTKYADQLPYRLPDTVRHFGFVPLSKLLPHTAALVHHGGIGTCAQGLAAGVPHLVQPMSYDQFDNSRRLVRLGVAKEISRRSFRGPAVAAALSPLLESPAVAAKCSEFAERCDGPAALAAACDALEELIVGQDDRGVRRDRIAPHIL